MKKPFNTLTKIDVEELRKKPAGISKSNSEFIYNFSSQDIADAIKHLESLYDGKIYQTFAEKILIRNEIY